MTIPFQAAILRIWRGQGAVVGTGFLVRGVDQVIYGVTCAHVVNAALGCNDLADADDKTGRLLECDLPFAGSSRLAAKVVAWRAPAGPLRSDPVHDIAVLAFDPTQPRAEPLVLRLEPGERIAPGTPFTGYGFMAVPQGLPLQGLVQGTDAGGWLVVEAMGEIGRFIEEGVSGGALLSGGLVLGMAVRRFEREARQGLAIPAFALAQAFPPLARPYVGLSAFKEGTAHLFHGRSAAVAELDRRLAAQGRVAVLGPSGAGKSSLVMGGLVPRRRRAGWLPVPFRPSSPSTRPLLNLAAALIAAEGRPPDPNQGDRAAAMAAELAAQPTALSLRLAMLRQSTGAVGVLVVIDQAEEFFTAAAAFDPALRAERAGLLAELLRLTAATDPDPATVACVLTARTDLLAPLADRPDTTPFLEGSLWLTAMAERDVADAIEAPARLFGVEVDRALSDGLAAQMEGEPGRLPFLGLTLQDLWPGIRRGPDGWRLAMPASGAPRIEDAIAARAREVEVDYDDASRPALDRVLSRLVGLAGEGAAQRAVRRVLRRHDISAEDWTLVQRLAVARLVTITGDRADPDAVVAELVHDKLIDGWGRLGAMVAADAEFIRFRDGLEADLQRWEQEGRTADRLLPAANLPRAVRFLAARQHDLTPGGVAFVQASVRYWDIRQRREQARTRRRLRTGSALFAFGGLLALAAWLLALEARDQRGAALRLESGLYVDHAREALREGDAERAYLIAAQAAWWRDAEPLARRPWLAEVDEVLLEAARLMVSPRVTAPYSGFIPTSIRQRRTEFALSPDGSRGVSWANWVADVYEHTFVDDLSTHPASFTLKSAIGDNEPRAVFAADGRTVLIADRQGLAQLTYGADLPPWPFPCPEPGRGCGPPVTMTAVDAASASAVLRDRSGHQALLRLDPAPGLIALPDMPAEFQGGSVSVSLDGRTLLFFRKADILNRVRAVQVMDGRATPLAPIEAQSVRRVMFLGSDRLVRLTRSGEIVTTPVGGDGQWQVAASGTYDAASIMHATADGQFLVVFETSEPMVFKRSGEGLTRILLPDIEDRLGFLHPLQGLLETRNASSLLLFDLATVSSLPIEQRPGRRFDTSEHLILSGNPRVRQFVLQTSDRAEFWAPGEDVQERVGVLYENLIAADGAARGGITFNQSGTHVAVPFPDAFSRTVMSTASVLAQRGDPDDPVPAAERLLKNCLTSSQAQALTGRAAAPPDAAPHPVAGRHACASLKSAAAEPRPRWESWRPLARELLAVLSGTEGPPPRPRPVAPRI